MVNFDFEPVTLRELLPRVTFDGVLQTFILFSTVAAMALLTTPGYVKAGCLVGLFSQPFWFTATWRARQPGMFLVACIQTGFWIRGIVAYS
ncbi:MAG TPA: hypothetical protein VE008_07180 [Burkholderiales bacterium]|nr:hypothetical protein [Burkholderiales bacterium]